MSESNVVLPLSRSKFNLAFSTKSSTCLSVAKQTWTAFTMDKEISAVSVTNRGKKCIFIDGYKLRESRVLRNGDSRFRCSNTSCAFSLSVDVSNKRVVEYSKVEHTHRPYSECEVSKLLMKVSLKSKAVESPNEKTSALIRRELLSRENDPNLKVGSKEVAGLKQMVYRKRQKILPLVPKKLPGVSETLHDTEIEKMDESTIDQCLKSKRTDNFTSEEKCIFIDLLVNKYKSLHEDRTQNKENNVLKRETWKSLLKDFHTSAGNSRRTLTQIKTLYENTKHRIKKCVEKGVFEIDWEPVNESGTFKIPIQLFEKIRGLYEQKSAFQAVDEAAELELATDETGLSGGDKEDDPSEEGEATTLEDYPNFMILNSTKPVTSSNHSPKFVENDGTSDTQSQEQDGPLVKKSKPNSSPENFSLPKEFLSTTEEFSKLAQVRAAAAQAELKLELQQNKQRHIAELRVLDLKAKAQQAKIEYYNMLKKRLMSQNNS